MKKLVVLVLTVAMMLTMFAVSASAEEMEKLIREVIDPLPGVIDCSCNIILSRIKDIKGLRL